jgi:tetratricopeptide (TPR) repeat protein
MYWRNHAVKTVCEYHPTKPAEWICPSCNNCFCRECIDNRVVQQYGKKKVFHFCPKCNVEAERMAFKNSAVGFWNRLPKFFIYPFHPRALILMASTSVAAVLVSGPGLFRILLQFAIWGVVLKYSFSALKTTARGNLTPPKINLETISSDFDMVFKQIGIYLVIGVAFAKVLQSAGIFIGLLFLGLAILSVPAMIIVLVATNSFLRAINPVVFMPMAWRIGWAYLLMYLFLIFLGAAPAVLGHYIIAFLPNSLHGFLLSMAESFYTIVSYHLMGYVLFQYHEEIGYEVDLDDEYILTEDSVSEKSDENPLLNRIDILVKEGNIDDAIALIKDETGGVIPDLDLAERYYNLLKVKQLTPQMLEHGKVYLEHLAKANQKQRLCEVYLECASKDATFKTAPSASFKIASALNEAGKAKAAIGVYNNFIKENPMNPLTPKAYFLAASVINDQLKNPTKAVRILKGLIKKYPKHDIIPYVQKYLGQIHTT